MAKYIVKQKFKGAPQGAVVELFVQSTVVTPAELGPDLFKIAKDEGWIEKVTAAQLKSMENNTADADADADANANAVLPTIQDEE
jgi:hypothetical protein